VPVRAAAVLAAAVREVAEAVRVADEEAVVSVFDGSERPCPCTGCAQRRAISKSRNHKEGESMSARKLLVVVDDRIDESLSVSASAMPLRAWVRECAQLSLLDAIARSVRGAATHFALLCASTMQCSEFALSTDHVLAALRHAGAGAVATPPADARLLLHEALRCLQRCRAVCDESVIVLLAHDASGELRLRVEAVANAERNVKFSLVALGARDRVGEKHRVVMRANWRAYVVADWSELDAVARKAGAALGSGAVAAAAVAGKAVSQALLESAAPAGAAAEDVRLDVSVSLQLGHQRVQARLVPLGPCDTSTARHVAAIATQQPVFSIVGFCYAADLHGGPVSAFAVPFALHAAGDASAGGERECESHGALLLRGLSIALADEDSCAVVQVCLSKHARGNSESGAPIVTHAVLRPAAKRGAWPLLVFARDQRVSIDQQATWADLAACVSLPPPQVRRDELPTTTPPPPPPPSIAAVATVADVTPKRKRVRPISASRQAQLAKQAAADLAAFRSASSLYAGQQRKSDEQTPIRLLADLNAAQQQIATSAYDAAKVDRILKRLKTLAAALSWAQLSDATERAERIHLQRSASNALKRKRRRRSALNPNAPPTTIIKIPARVTRHLVSDEVLMERRRERRRKRERERRAAQRLSKSDKSTAEAAPGDESASSSSSGNVTGSGGSSSSSSSSSSSRSSSSRSSSRSSASDGGSNSSDDEASGSIDAE
jgi:hypothetical protein